MKKTKILAFGLCVLFVALTTFLACNKLQKSNQLSTVSDPIANAKAYFLEKVLSEPKPDSKTVEQNPWASIHFNPNWDKAMVQLIQNKKWVVVPVTMDKPLVNYLEGGSIRLPVEKNTYLVFFSDSSSNMHAQVVTKSYDERYFDDTNKVKKFNGTIVVRDWNENLIKGFHYTEGIEDGKIKQTSFNQIQGKKSPQNVKESVATPQLAPPGGSAELICTVTDWYIYGSIDGGATWDSEYWYSESDCVDLGTPVEDETPDGSAVYVAISGPTPSAPGEGSFAWEITYGSQTGKNLCQAYNWATKGNGYTATINYIQQPYSHTTEPYETYIINFINTCVTIPVYGITSQKASTLFNEAYNYAWSQTIQGLNDGTVAPNPSAITANIKKLVNSDLKNLQPGSLWNTLGPCTPDVPVNEIDPKNGWCPDES